METEPVEPAEDGGQPSDPSGSGPAPESMDQ